MRELVQLPSSLPPARVEVWFRAALDVQKTCLCPVCPVRVIILYTYIAVTAVALHTESETRTARDHRTRALNESPAVGARKKNWRGVKHKLELSRLRVGSGRRVRPRPAARPPRARTFRGRELPLGCKQLSGSTPRPLSSARHTARGERGRPRPALRCTVRRCGWWSRGAPGA